MLESSRERERGGGVPVGLFEPQWLSLVFRVTMVGCFLFAVWRWGDWRRWRIYYPTMLFAISVNLFASYVSYHHDLWIFNPDALVRSHTVVEIISTFVIMPATVLVYLSNFPAAGRVLQGAYVLAWVAVYSALETADTLLGGISYANGWSLAYSYLFDCAMFPIFSLHHSRPLLGWLATLAMAAYILTAFGFWGTEMK